MRLYGTHTQEVAERIIDAFRRPEHLPKALAPIFIKRNNDVPCRIWSWHNQLLVALCGTTDARGIKQWNRAGRRVKQGSKAIWILAPCIKSIRKDGENGNEYKNQNTQQAQQPGQAIGSAQAQHEPQEHKVVYGFKSVPVFAVEDTEGEPLPDSSDGYDTWIEQLPLLEVARAWDISVDAFTHHNADPHGYFRHSGFGSAAVMLGVENLSTWAHELVHAADHRLTKLTGDKWHKEIVAELGGAILLECLGLSYDADLGGAFAYVESYAHDARKGVVRACIELLERVCTCVKLILDTAEQVSPEVSIISLSTAMSVA